MAPEACLVPNPPEMRVSRGAVLERGRFLKNHFFALLNRVLGVLRK